jgi:tetratricopeptide (TPR) repeat protein
MEEKTMKTNSLSSVLYLVFFVFFIFDNFLIAQTSFDVTNKTSGDTLFHIENDGSVGIGTTSPAAELQVEGEDGALFTGTFSSGLIPVEGIGTRLMWYPGKAAFRVGHTAGTFWNDVNIGNYSIALGYNTIASANNSTAFGSTTIASGVYSTAMGIGTRALGLASTAMGINTQAEGAYSTALGESTMAYGDYSIAIGKEIEARGSHTIAIALSDQNGLQAMQDSTLAIMGGKVGIGTVIPTTALHVADTIYSSVGGFKFPDGSVQETAATGGGASTLDQAYDGGGSGLGRTITADAGALEVGGNDGVLFTGTHGSGTIPFEGAGVRMMWYPNKAAFRVGRVYDTGSTNWNNMYIGNYSIASGYNTRAWGSYSTAFGNSTNANGHNSFAVGNLTSANGESSVAMGEGTTASGSHSTAIGQEIEAAGSHTVAIALSDQNGLSITQDSAMAIMGGKVGINESAPNAELQVGGTNGVLFTGTSGSGTIPLEGAGVRMMWYPNKSAFRAGRVTGDYWNDVNIGLFSIASGNDTRASGHNSTATGAFTTANGDYSTAMGYSTEASGDYSTAMGYGTEASASYSTAMGGHTRAINNYSTAMGYYTEAVNVYSTAMGSYTLAGGEASTAMGGYTRAINNYSTAMGYETEAGGDYSTAMGYGTEAGGEASTAMGYNSDASGYYSTAMGIGTEASGYYSTAMGYFSKAEGISAVAIGRSGKAHHDGSVVISANIHGTSYDSVYTGGNEQLVLRADGGMYITNTSGEATYNPSRIINTSIGAYLSSGGTWTNASSREYKENISNLSLEQAINTVQQLQPVTYNYKADQEENCVGFISEDVPDLVAVKDRKGLSPMDIVAVLTKVVQNQQQEMEIMKEEIKRLKNK